jgi:hypothetical protein
VLRAAARRLLVLLVGVAGGTALVSLALGAAAGSAVNRSVSLGFYVVGSFLLIGGFFVGNRGPLRAVGEHGLLAFWGRKGVRPARPDERREEMNMSVFFFLVGLIMLVLGILTDSRVSLV